MNSAHTVQKPGARQWWPMIVLGLLALGVRIAHLLTMRDSPFFQYPIMDSLIHDEWAWAVVSGAETPWHPPFFRAPLYPYLLAAVYAVFGHSYTWARVVQMILGSFSVVLVFSIGHKVFDRRTAWIAGLVACFYWMFPYFEGELLIVPLIVFLDLAALLVLIKTRERGDWRRSLLAGLLLGLSAIARPNILLFVAAAGIWLLIRERRKIVSSITRQVAPLALGLVIPILPITIANTLAGDFVFIASQGGVNFYIGNNPDSDATQAVVPGTRTDWWGGYHDTILIAEQDAGRSLKPSEVSDYWYRRGFDFIASQPASAARLFLRKLYLFWNHREFGNNQDIYFVQSRSPVLRILSIVGFGIIAPLGLVGMAFAWRRRPASRVLTVFVLTYMVSILLFFVNARYRMPVVPVLLIFGAYAAGVLVDRARSRDVREVLGLGIPLVLFTAAVNSNYHGLAKSNAAFGHFNLGLTYRHTGHPDLAIQEFRNALKHEPDRRDARHNLAMALIETGDPGEAETLLGALVTRYPNDPEARYALGSAMMAMGNLDGAVEELTRATSLRPYFYEAWHSLGVAQYRMERFGEAERSFRTSLEIHPRFAPAYNNLGILLAIRGDVAGAREMFEEALRIDPTHAGARENLARLPGMEP